MSLVQKLYMNVREANQRGVKEVKYLFLSEALRVRPVSGESKCENILTLPNIFGAYIQGVVNSENYKWIRYR